MSGIWNYSGMLAKEYMACMTAVTGLWLNVIYSVALGSPIIDGIFLVHKMCIYSSVMIITDLPTSHTKESGGQLENFWRLPPEFWR